MQNAPIVQLPEKEHHRNWGLVVAAVAVILVAVFAVVMLAYPDLLSPEPAASTQITEVSGVAGPDNPELFAFYRYTRDHPNEEFLRENPEVRYFLQWQESR